MALAVLKKMFCDETTDCVFREDARLSSVEGKDDVRVHVQNNMQRFSSA